MARVFLDFNVIRNVFVQLTVRACDSGIPQRCIETDINIQIDRSTRPPSFTNTPFEKFIPETMPVGTSILKLEAFDASLKVSNMYMQFDVSTHYSFTLSKCFYVLK